MKCFGFHKWRILPWMKTKNNTQPPHKACLRCGKLWFKARIYVPSIEGSIRRAPMWEGESAPKGYASWREYHERTACHRRDAEESSMKIWVDDIRTPPSLDWYWCKTSDEAIKVLMNEKWFDEHVKPHPIKLMSLDHDLGGDDTTRPVVLWMCENEFWPEEVRVHSANPVGAEWLEGMIERYKT